MWKLIFQRPRLMIKFLLGLCFSLGTHKLVHKNVWAAQMRRLVILPENCGTIPGWTDWSWSTDTDDSILLSFHFFMDPYFFIFVLHCHEIDKGYIFGVAFGRLISFLPTWFIWFWFLFPGYDFFYWKIICWHPQPFEIYF